MKLVMTEYTDLPVAFYISNKKFYNKNRKYYKGLKLQ